MPVHNEAGNIEPLTAEIEAALEGRIVFEIVYVDDGSGAEFAALRRRFARLRVLRHRNLYYIRRTKRAEADES